MKFRPAKMPQMRGEGQYHPLGLYQNLPGLPLTDRQPNGSSVSRAAGESTCRDIGREAHILKQIKKGTVNVADRVRGGADGGRYHYTTAPQFVVANHFPDPAGETGTDGSER